MLHTKQKWHYNDRKRKYLKNYYNKMRMYQNVMFGTSSFFL